MFQALKKNLKYVIPALVLLVFAFYPENASAAIFDWVNPKKWIEALLFIVLQVCGFIFMLAGLFLELIVQYSIVQMRSFIEPIQSIDVAWRTIRDIANILFVFVLLLISINIILGSWGSGPYNKSLIPKVIIAALLINFSLFFTKVVIDVSNIVAYEFYNTAKNIAAPNPPPVFFKDFNGGITFDTGLTSSIANKLGVVSFMNMKAPEKPQNSFPIFTMLFGIITVLIAAFVFIVMSFLLLTRFIAFVFLMITSPIAFIGELLPQLQPYAKKWWKALSDQAVFAPIFFVLILITVLIINDPSFGTVFPKATAPGQIPSDVSGFKELIAITFNYAIVIGLLIAALIAAKQTSGMASNAIVSWGSKLAGKGVFGTTAALGRNTLGRAGNALANSGWAGNLSKKGGFTGGIGKGLILAGDQTRNWTFDARGVKAAGALGAGDVGVKGGLVGAQKARKEKIEERGKVYTNAQAIASQREDIQRKKDELAKAEDEVLSVDAVVGPGAQLDEARKKRDKARSDLQTAESALLELQGKNTKEREALSEATQKLTNAQRQEADTAKKVVDAQEEYIKGLKSQLKVTADQGEKDKINEKIRKAESGLKEYRRTEIDNKPLIKEYMEKLEAVAKATKAAGGQTSASQRAYGEALAGGSFKSTRQAGDSLRKGKEKPEESIASEILKALKASEQPDTSGGSGGTTPATPPPGGGTPPGGGGGTPPPGGTGSTTP